MSETPEWLDDKGKIIEHRYCRCFLEKQPMLSKGEDELAIFLHISRAGAYNLLNSKDFPTLHVGGRKLVTKENVLLWMMKNTNKIA